LFASLNIVCSIIRGSESVLPLWIEPPLELVKSSLGWNVPIMPICGMKGHVTMSDGSNVRHYFVGIMSEVQRVMLENAEDNTKSFFALIRVCIYIILYFFFVFILLSLSLSFSLSLSPLFSFLLLSSLFDINKFMLTSCFSLYSFFFFISSKLSFFPFSSILIILLLL